MILAIVWCDCTFVTTTGLIILIITRIIYFVTIITISINLNLVDLAIYTSTIYGIKVITTQASTTQYSIINLV